MCVGGGGGGGGGGDPPVLSGDISAKIGPKLGREHCTRYGYVNEI